MKERFEKYINKKFKGVRETNEVKEEKDDLINVNNMKKVNTVQKAKEENAQLQKPQINLDTRQIHQQRTLQYMDNRGGSTMLPIF